VLARRDTLGYRAAKFLRRNLAASVAAALVVLAVAAGAAATLWQASVANRERARAERRFNEVRNLGRTTIFEIDEALRKLPGATPVRAVLVKRQVELLDGLAKDAANDVSLELELSAAYRRLGRIQGNALVANLGDAGGAAKSLQKALALSEAAVASNPRDRAARAELSGCLFDLAMVIEDSGRQAQLLDRALQLDEQLIAEEPSNLQHQHGLVSVLQQRGSLFLVTGDLDKDLAYQRRALDVSQRIVDAGNRKRNDLSGLSFSHKKVGAVLIRKNQLPDALDHYHAALALDEQILAMDPRDPTFRYDITYTLSDTGLIYWRQKDFKKAQELYVRVLGIREGLAREDPNNARFRHGVASTCNYLGDLVRDRGDWKGAVEYLHRSPAFAGNDDADTRAQLFLKLGRGYAAGVKAGAPVRQQAAEAYRTALQLFGAQKTPSDPDTNVWIAEARKGLTAMDSKP
jgi:non-specific serine/threonine protein kinase/serine/threonine-protein kinase